MYTIDELRARFFRAFAGDADNNRFNTGTSDPSDADVFLQDALEELTREFRTYRKEKIVPVSNGVNVYDRADVVPSVEVGEAVSSIVRAQFQRGNSGIITSVSEDDLMALFHAAGIGAIAKAGDKVQICGIAAYNGVQTIMEVNADTFKTTQVYGTSGTGQYIMESDYVRAPLTATPYEEVEASFSNLINPQGEQVPTGTLFMNWSVVSRNLPAGMETIDPTIFPADFNKHLADTAVILALASINDDRLPVLLQTCFPQDRDSLEAWAQRTVPHEKMYFGRAALRQGLYGYRQQTENSLIIYPNIY